MHRTMQHMGERGRHRSRRLVVALAASAALLVAACGGDDSSGDEGGGSTTAASTGATTTAATGSSGSSGSTTPTTMAMPADADPEGTLRIGTNMNISSGYFIDPIKGAAIMYDGIAYLHLGAPLYLGKDGTVQPYLAEGWDIPDASTFVLELRSGVSYQDGKPYDAASLKAMYDAKLASTETAWIGGIPRQIDTITVDSPTQLTFKMKTPIAGLMPLLMTQTFGHSASPGYDPAKPAGAGPYKVVSYEDKRKLVLEKWDGAWNADDFWLKTIEFIHLDPASTVNAIQAGQVDLVATSPNQIDQIAASGGFGSLFTNNQAHYHFVTCNTAPPFNDATFREAFYLAVDQEAMNQGVMGGNAEVMTSFWPEDSPYAVEDLIDPKGDQAKAKQLVTDNGWEGTVVRIGMYNVPTQQKIAEVLQAQVEAVGLKAELIPFPPTGSPYQTITPETGGGGYVVANTFPGIGKFIQSALLAPVGPSTMCPDDPNAHADLRADANALIGGDLTEAETVEHWKDLQTNVMAQYLDMPMLSQPAAYLYNKKVVGLEPGTIGLTAATAPGPFLEHVYVKK